MTDVVSSSLANIFRTVRTVEAVDEETVDMADQRGKTENKSTRNASLLGARVFPKKAGK